MADKAFNELPMVTVISDALDPRTKRQLQAQLQSELKTVSEVDAEIKNAESMESVKQQYDSAKKETEFDDSDTKETKDPAPVEDAQPADDQKDQGGKDEDPFSDESSDGQDGGQDAQQQSDSNPPPAQEQPTPPANDVPSDQTSQPASGNGEASAADAFDGGSAPQPAQAPAPAAQPAPAQQPAQQPAPAAQPAAQAAPAPAPSAQQDQGAVQGQNGDDPFSDDGPTFESFSGILGFQAYKTEAAEEKQTADSNLPPMKQLVYIRGTDQGVDKRTNVVIAAMEDPQNTVVVLDLSDVADTPAKMEFQSVKKQLQERGITVVDSIDEAVDYLNDVYDQISGKAE